MPPLELSERVESAVPRTDDDAGWGLEHLVIDPADTEQKALSATVSAIERKWGLQYTGGQKVE